MIRVDRCVCYERTFAELKNIAESEGATSLPELQEYIEFGRNCRLCHPYIRKMLQTGETVFHQVIEEDEGPA